MTLAETGAETLYPLSLFRQRAGVALPPCEVIEGPNMPEPYRRLLVHYGDMTSRLETFYNSPIVLHLLNREADEETYRREVVLMAGNNKLPVEYGAIEIQLGAFSPEIRKEILEERVPLGGLLNRQNIRYHSEPRAFFRLGADIELNALFSAAGSREFYGRGNDLLSDEGMLLARIVEVLRP